MNKKIIGYLIGAAILILLPFLGGSEYVMSVVCLGLIYVIAVNGLDLLFGYSGQISMGHAAYYAIGAYGTVLLKNYCGVPVFWAMIISAFIAAAVGAVIAFPASKLVFHFLSLSTIAFGEIMYQLILHSPNEITGNASGIFMDRLSIFGYTLKTYSQFYWFALACVIIFLVAKVNIVSGKTGRAFQAIRENTHAAAGMGINVRAYKVLAFALSAFYTAFAGGMYIAVVGYISPDTFTQKQSVFFITMLVFGGTASIKGPIIGVFSLMLLTELLRPFAEYQVLIYGVILLLVILTLPGGLYGAVKDILARRKRKSLAGNKEGEQ